MTELVLYDAACKALAEACRVDEAKDIRDKAIALLAYAKQAKNKELEADATVLRLRAERRLGEFIHKQKKTVGLNQGGVKGKTGVKNTPVLDDRPTLAAAGIDKNLAKQARALGALSSAQFETVVKETRKAVNAVTRNVVNKQMKKERRDTREKAVAASLPDGVFGIAVEDFEWDQQTYSDKGRSKHASNTYETSTDAHTAEEIFERTKERFRCVATDHALSFMWVTIPHLFIGMQLMQLRGFRYVSNIVWEKEDHLGTGYWVREVHEQLLIGVRGSKIPAPLPGSQLKSIITARKPNSVHSSKPELFLEWIEKTYPNIPKVEFNRRGSARPGWSAWGNEVSEAAE